MMAHKNMNVLHDTLHLKMIKMGVPGGVKLVKSQTLSSNTGHDLKVVRLSSTLGSILSPEST